MLEIIAIVIGTIVALFASFWLMLAMKDYLSFDRKKDETLDELMEIQKQIHDEIAKQLSNASPRNIREFRKKWGNVYHLYKI